MKHYPYPKLAFVMQDGKPIFAPPHVRAGQPVPQVNVSGTAYIVVGPCMYPVAALAVVDRGAPLLGVKFLRKRDEEIAALCNNGVPLQKIADQYGVTRQRIKSVVDRLVAAGVCVRPAEARLGQVVLSQRI